MCKSKRGIHGTDILFQREMIVWIDETGSATRDAIRKYGYALHGMYHRVLTRGKRVNAIAAMSSTGIVAVDLTTNNVNGDIFFDILRASVIPNMMPFNGTNPHSITIVQCTIFRKSRRC